MDEHKKEKPLEITIELKSAKKVVNGLNILAALTLDRRTSDSLADILVTMHKQTGASSEHLCECMQAAMNHIQQINDEAMKLIEKNGGRYEEIKLKPEANDG